MASALSNASMTALQFMPSAQLQDTKVSVGVTPQTISPDRSAGSFAGDLATNIGKLHEALGTQALMDEKVNQAKGLIDAQNLYNESTPEDRKKLSVMDAAQQAGMVDSGSNPYFKAYGDKMRGQLLSSDFSQEYQETYAGRPAKTPEEEQSRYVDFMNKKKNDLGNTIAMNTAFDMGYGEQIQGKATQLAQAHVQKDIADKASAVLMAAKASLGNANDDAKNLLATNGALTNAYQTAINTLRMSGTPLEQTATMAANAITDLSKTGQIDPDRARAMTEHIVLESNADGTPKTTLADVVDKETIHKATANFYESNFTRQSADFINKHAKDTTMDATFKEIEAMPAWQQPIYYKLVSTIQGQQKAEQARQQALLLAQAKKAQKSADSQATLSAHWGAYMAGNPTAGISMQGVLPADVSAFFDSKVVEVMNSGKDPASVMNDLQKVTSFVPFSTFKTGMQKNYEAVTENIRTNPDGSISGDTGRLSQLINYQSQNPAAFRSIFGEKLSGDINCIRDFTSVGGSTDAGIRNFADYNSLDDASKKQYEENGKYLMRKGTYSDGTPITMSLTPVGGGDDETVSIASYPRLSQQISRSSALYQHQGYSPEDATKKAINDISYNMTSYKGALIPRDMLGDGEGPIRQALNNMVWSVNDDGNAVNVQFDEDSQQFVAYDNTGRTVRKSLAQIKYDAQAIYEATLNGTAVPQSDATQQQDNSFNNTSGMNILI